MKNKKTTYFIIGICTFIISLSLVAALNGVKDTYAATGACYFCTGVPKYIWSSSGGTPSDTCTGGSWSKVADDNCATNVTATFNANGGTIVGSSSLSCSYLPNEGSCTITGLPVATKANYTFKGWGQQQGCSAGMTSSLKLVTNTVYYACYTKNEETNVTIRFNANSGTIEDNASETLTKTLTLNSDFTFPKVTRDGYTFLNWKDDNAGTTYKAGGSGVAYSNRSFTAQWEINTYTVTYDANGGTGAPASQTKTYGVDLTLSSTKPTRELYTFKGWGTLKDASSVAYPAGGKYINNANIKLYALWEENYYIITFDSNGGTNPVSEARKVTKNESFEFPSPTKSGYTLLNWKDDSTGTTYEAGKTGIAYSNRSFTAQWEKNPSTFTSTFKKTDGTVLGTKSCTTSSGSCTVSASDLIETPAGYTFAGWSATTACKMLTQSIRLTGNATYYACFTVNSTNSGSSGSGSSSGGSSSGTTSQTVYAYYDFNGGTLSSGNNYSQCTITGTVTSCSVTPPTPTREGYTFSGYRKSGETSCKTGNLVLTQNTNYQACWDKSVTEEESSSDSTGTYKALYEPEGGTVKNNKTYDECAVSEGETSCKITLPLSEKEGYEFNGWRKSGETTCQTGEVSLTQTTRFFACYSSDKIDVPIEDIPIGDIIDKINEEIENNSKTGDILIFICWVVGIGAIAFATYYYHYHKKEI